MAVSRPGLFLIPSKLSFSKLKLDIASAVEREISFRLELKDSFMDGNWLGDLNCE